MSFRALTWAWDQHLPPAQKFVLLALVQCQDDETGECRAKDTCLAGLAGITVLKVQRAICQLKHKRLIQQIESGGYEYEFNLGTQCARGADDALV